MTFSIGLLCLILGAAGSILCIARLIIMEKNWKKQRKKMLKMIEEEE